MASIYDLKPKFQNLLRPVCAAFARAGITANQVTVAALILSIAEGAWIAATRGSTASMIALPLVLFARMALNAIDGMLAREFNQKTRLGAVLNEAGDIVSDVALYLPFALIPGLNPLAVLAIVVTAVMSELVGIAAIRIGGERRYDGPLGKSDRAFFFAVFAVAVAVGLWPGLYSDLVLWIGAAFGVVTTINRARKTLAARKR